MKKLVNRWHYISVYLAGAVALVGMFGPWDTRQKLLVASTSILFLHFFEEFGCPGGFPHMAVKVLLGSDEPDSSKWSSNNLSSMLGNWGFLVLVYLAALAFPDVPFLTLSAMVFSIAELFMHAILFNVKGKQLYNPGAVTAVVGLAPIAIYYFATVFDRAAFAWYDYLLAVAWFSFVFWLTFRSPWYWRLGRVPGYRFTDQTAYGIDHVERFGEPALGTR